MAISVIIPALDEEEEIETCLKSLRKQKFEGKYEIILVDGFSQDKTVERAKPYVDKVLKKHAHGPAAARNVGAEHAKYDVLAFIDADCEAEKDWLERIQLDFINEKLMGVGGVLRPREGSWFDNVVFKINSDWWVRLSTIFGIYQLYGNNCAYRKEIFKKLCGFSTEISFFEDTELSMRAKKVGKIKIDPNLIVYASTRRFKQKGYLSVAAKNVQAFFNFLLGRPIKTRYFDTIDHNKNGTQAPEKCP
ncbi:Glycosyltransferase AglE [Candidatus Burarchaeum australiense]|nr:Glycosyltransferase AglE [Candidatus Burarchaeum australiense]